MLVGVYIYTDGNVCMHWGDIFWWEYNVLTLGVYMLLLLVKVLLTPGECHNSHLVNIITHTW